MPFLRKISSCGLLFGGCERIGGDVVDRLLAFLHAGHVVGQRDAFVGMRRREAQQLGQALLVGVVLADAFLEHRAELLPELRRTFPSGSRPASSSIDSTRLVEPSRMAFTSRLSCSSSRETLSGRSALSITPLTKRRYTGINASRLVHDEDALDVELHARRACRGSTGRTAPWPACTAAACIRCALPRGCACRPAAPRCRS